MRISIPLHLATLNNECSTVVLCLLLACSTNTQSGQQLTTLTHVGKAQLLILKRSILIPWISVHFQKIFTMYH